MNKYQITIGNNSNNFFIGNVITEHEERRGIHGRKVIQLQGHWENHDQLMTITFSQPLCNWEKVGEVDETVSVETGTVFYCPQCEIPVDGAVTYNENTKAFLHTECFTVLQTLTKV